MDPDLLLFPDDGASGSSGILQASNESPSKPHTAPAPAKLLIDESAANGTEGNATGTVENNLCNQIIPATKNASIREFETERKKRMRLYAGIPTTESNYISYNVTNYIIYDANGHTCALDLKFTERTEHWYLTGYLKPYNNFDVAVKNGFEINELGPILSSFLISVNGASNISCGISTAHGYYILMKPHPSYKKYLALVGSRYQDDQFDTVTNREVSINHLQTYDNIITSVLNSIKSRM